MEFERPKAPDDCFDEDDVRGRERREDDMPERAGVLEEDDVDEDDRVASSSVMVAAPTLTAGSSVSESNAFWLASVPPNTLVLDTSCDLTSCSLKALSCDSFPGTNEELLLLLLGRQK